MKMKKFIAVLSMAAMIGTLAVGCGKSNEESKGEDAKGKRAATGILLWTLQSYQEKMVPVQEARSLSFSE